jgi:ABC-2 type transport system ATP-binding protein
MSVLAIQTNELTKNYRKIRGINNVNLSVEAGEIYGFIGPNGAGKSTTIRTLLALIHPTSGSATIFGKDCVKEAAQIARDVSYLPSEPSYYDNMRVKEFLNYAAALYGVKASEKIKELSERLNLDINRRISDLSLGNKKKVGIVSCLLHSPKLIILDEPTSGLDPLMQQTFFDILLEENKNGATIFFSSHVLSEVQKICGRVAILKEGKVISIQRISELRDNGYKRIQLTASSEIPKDYFGISGVMNLQQENTAASFMFKGSISEILRKIASLPVVDIIIEEPSLEEIFLHYYN